MISPRRLLLQHGIRPSKRRGQSFLADADIVRRIAATLELKPGDRIVEIGAGLGVLTALLREKAEGVLAVEVDPRLAAVLRKAFPEGSGVTVLMSDILRCDFGQIVAEGNGRKVTVVGNLPYSVTSPILFHLLRHRAAIREAVVMVQKEVADRLLASPGTKAYGIPTVLFRLHAHCDLLFHVPPRCFYPVPDVMSAVIRIAFREPPAALAGREDALELLLRAVFSQRRKMIANTLRSSGLGKCLTKGVDGAPAGEKIDALLARTGIDGRRRPETLSPEEFLALCDIFVEARVDEKE